MFDESSPMTRVSTRDSEASAAFKSSCTRVPAIYVVFIRLWRCRHMY